MKITTNKVKKEDLNGYVTETFYTQTIEADARELRESNTLASNFAAMLSRAFQSNEPFDDEEDEKEENDEEDDEDDWDTED